MFKLDAIAGVHKVLAIAMQPLTRHGAPVDLKAEVVASVELCRIPVMHLFFTLRKNWLASSRMSFPSMSLL